MIDRLDHEIQYLCPSLGETFGGWFVAERVRKLRERLSQCGVHVFPCSAPMCSGLCVFPSSCNHTKFCPVCNARVASERAARLGRSGPPIPPV